MNFVVFVFSGERSKYVVGTSIADGCTNEKVDSRNNTRRPTYPVMVYRGISLISNLRVLALYDLATSSASAIFSLSSISLS